MSAALSRGEWVTAGIVAALDLLLVSVVPGPLWSRLLLVTVVTAVAVGLVLLARVPRRLARKRYRAVANWAAELGLRPRAGGEQPGWSRRLPRHGTLAGLGPVYSGEYRGRSVSVGEYTYVTAAAGERDFHYAVVAVISLTRPVTELAVEVADTPKWVPNKRRKERTPTGDDEFDARFWVFADGGAAAPLLAEPMRRALLSARVPPWEAHGSQLIVSYPLWIRASSVRAQLDQAVDAAELLDARP
jgi:hypothetical protein